MTAGRRRGGITVSTTTAWYYDEFKQIGTDYASAEEVARYDERMAKIRNLEEECEAILALLDVPPGARVLDLGCGTCEFAIRAARRCCSVIAADISPVMLEYAAGKAQAHGVGEIEFVRAGLLSFEFADESLDAVVTQLALHHLSDFWKGMALRRIWRALKRGGRFYLRDVVYPFGIDDAPEMLEKWIGDLKSMRSNVECHIRDEHSTFDWIMEGLLRSAGFTIFLARQQGAAPMIEYLCLKP